MRASSAGLERIDNFIFNLKQNASGNYNEKLSQMLANFRASFEREMNDDFNTPNAIASLFDFIKEGNVIVTAHDYDEKNKAEILDYLAKIDKIFKCFDTLHENKKDDRAERVQRLIDERNEYRKARDFKKADELKAEIIALGVELQDNKDGTTSFRIL